MTGGGAIGFALEVHDEIGSTSDVVIERARSGAPAGLAILARRQTRPRGSRGRSWTEPAGNLAISVLLRPAVEAGKAGMLALAAGLALHDALRPHVGTQRELSVKWPNDLLLDGGKVAGILVESELDADGRLAWVSIGFGANLAAAPSVAGRDTACIADGHRVAAPDPVDVARDLLRRLPVRLSASAEAVRRDWLARAHPLGTQMSVLLGERVRRGRFDGVSGSGALRLATGDGTVEFRHGTVMIERTDVPCFS